MSATDRSIGAVVSSLRSELGLSQAGLVRLVNEHGLSWHQQTVVRVESGIRSVRATELFALCDAFGVDVETFRTSEVRKAAAMARLSAATDAANAAEARRVAVVAELRSIQAEGEK